MPILPKHCVSKFTTASRGGFARFALLLHASCKCSLVNSKRSFYRSVNVILGKVLSTAAVDVGLHFATSSILLYGLEVYPLNRADMQSLDICVNRLLMKLFHTSNVSVVEECRHYFNFALPSELLCQRTEKFLRKLIAHV